MSSIPDFTEAEQWAVTTLKERWPGQEHEIQLADVEIRMHPRERELRLCPAMFWAHNKTSFVIIEVAEKTYRSKFYCRGFQRDGNGKSDFDHISDCVVTTLQVLAD